MIDYVKLLTDPRQLHDTDKWTKLFQLIPLTYKGETGEKLLKELWVWRSVGTKLIETSEGLRFFPILEPDGVWESKEEFDEFKQKYLRPYAREISQLLKKLEG